jgi:hypothetical protein
MIGMTGIMIMVIIIVVITAMIVIEQQQHERAIMNGMPVMMLMIAM